MVLYVNVLGLAIGGGLLSEEDRSVVIIENAEGRKSYLGCWDKGLR